MAMSTGPPATCPPAMSTSYWTAITMKIPFPTEQALNKSESDVFFCRKDPQPVNFRFGIIYDGSLKTARAFVEATQNVPKANMSLSLSDGIRCWHTLVRTTHNSGPPPSDASLGKNTDGYIYIGCWIIDPTSSIGNWIVEVESEKLDRKWKWKLVCEVEYEAPLPMKPPNETSNKSLHGDLLKLLESSENADVTFLVKGEKIKAHKAILGARSDYFQLMFSNPDVKESVSGEVDIQDFEPDVVTGMLQYLYSGLPPKNLAVIAMDLHAISDKYGLDELKRICESNIRSNLTAKTVVDALILADRHGCEELMDRAKIVFRTNIGAVKPSKQDWEKLRSHSDLAMKLLKFLCDIEEYVEDDIL